MLKTHEFTYIADRKNPLRQIGSRIGRRGHVNGYRVQIIRWDLPADFLIEPDRKIEHEDKVEMLWVR